MKKIIEVVLKIRKYMKNVMSESSESNEVYFAEQVAKIIVWIALSGMAVCQMFFQDEVNFFVSLSMYEASMILELIPAFAYTKNKKFYCAMVIITILITFMSSFFATQEKIIEIAYKLLRWPLIAFLCFSTFFIVGKAWCSVAINEREG